MATPDTHEPGEPSHHRVCPWWLGYWLVNPLRRFLEDPGSLYGELIREGMTVLEPGCGMGYFTLDLARRVGPSGRVVALDVQESATVPASDLHIATEVSNAIPGPSAEGRIGVVRTR